MTSELDNGFHCEESLNFMKENIRWRNIDTKRAELDENSAIKLYTDNLPIIIAEIKWF